MNAKRWGLLTFAVAATGLSGCALAVADLEVEGKVEVTFDGESNGNSTEVNELETIDLLTIPDYADNIDKIREADVYAFRIDFTNIAPGNEAQFIGGSVRVRVAGAPDDAWVEGVASWAPVPVSLQNSIYVEPEPTRRKALNDILFADDPQPVEFEVIGYSDAAPVNVTIEVTLMMTVRASGV